jgi:hypothetical protein
MGDGRFGVFGIGPTLVGLPAAEVQEIFVLPKPHPMPRQSACHRGIISLRGDVMPALDLRICFGMEPAEVELDAMLNLLLERERDHVNWLNTLEQSVKNGVPFTLAKDPHQCAFGRWYYAFHSEDAVLRSGLAAFEVPHAEIHAVADQIDLLRAEGKHAECLLLLERTRAGRLAELVRLFQSLRVVVREQHREIGVRVHLFGRPASLVADRAEAVAAVDVLAQEQDPTASGALKWTL